MSVFATLQESRQLGAPILGLFRTALGRDPDAHELAAFVPMLRGGAALPALAQRIVDTAEFQRRCGPMTGEALATALSQGAFGTADAGRPVALLAAALQASAAEMVATVASAALANGRIPLLPGVAPGAAPDDPVAYRLWVEEYDRLSAALAPMPALDGPDITILMRAGDTQAEAALRSAASLQAQAYGRWTLHLAARTLSPWSRDAILRLAAEEPRIRLADPEEPLWSGERRAADPDSLVCWLAPGDQLAPSAFHEAVAAFAAHPGTRLLYTDEDVIDGSLRRAPRFKPDFSPDAAFASDVIGQLALYRAGLLAGINADEQRLPGLAVRAAAAAGGVRHLPAILCHRGADPEIADPAAWPRLRIPLPDPTPTVTAIVPTRDHPALLAACTQGLLKHTTYGPLEVLVVDTGSTDPEALALLAELETDPRVRILHYPGPFNFAALNNAAAREARGDVLVLLNNDTEVLHPDWLGEMVSHAMRPDAGAVGARLLYPDGTIQHAGILLGPDGAATHVGRGAPGNAPGYLGQFACTRDLSAVTGACLAIRAEVWRKVGGMDERLAVTWNDIDLCLRVRHAGLRVIWTPFAALLHREGTTRGLEAGDAAREARFREEQAIVRARWGEALNHDPFLNPNLVATESGRLALAQPRRPRPWP